LEKEEDKENKNQEKEQVNRIGYNVKLPEELIKDVDRFLLDTDIHFKDRSDFVEKAISNFLKKQKKYGDG